MGTTVSWVNPTKTTDGGDYDAATENAGYVLAFDGGDGAVSLPLAFGTSFDYGTLQAYQDLKSGTHTLTLAVVTKEGVTGNFSEPATFRKTGTPLAPTSVAVA